MTTLYRPILIETAEQAEALPDGTIVRHDDYMPVERWHHDGVGYWDNCEFPPTSADLIGRTALVPVEAEEEVMPASRIAGRLTESGVEFTPDTGKVATWQRRYVTPWTEDTPAHPQETFTVPWETSGPSPHRRGGCA